MSYRLSNCNKPYIILINSHGTVHDPASIQVQFHSCFAICKLYTEGRTLSIPLQPMLHKTSASKTLIIELVSFHGYVEAERWEEKK